MADFKLLDPKMDFIFKLIFGNEKHPKILISFLNAVIKPKNKIVSVKIKNTELEKKHIEDKFARLDVKAVTSNDEVINIEIQLKNEYNMIKRSLYYLSKTYESQLRKNQDYSSISKTVAINILMFKYLDDEKEFHNAYRFKNIKNDKELTDAMELHFIELPKFNANQESKKIIDLLESTKTPPLGGWGASNIDMLKAWTLFLKKPESPGIINLENKIKEIKEAKDELNEVSADEKNRELYEMRENALHDRISALGSAKKKGIELGLKKAEKEIKKAQKEKEEILKASITKFLSMNLSITEIAETLGISENLIKELKD